LQKPGIIVLGGHIQSLGIIRIFGRENIPAIVVDNTYTNIARHSRFCSGFYYVPDNDLLAFLTKFSDSDIFKRWVIFPTNDSHVKLLSINKTELEKHYIVSTDNWDVVSIFYNKRNSYRLAEKINIPIAKTWFPDSIDDIKNYDIEFPCIVKPAVMHDFYKKIKKKVLYCKTPEDLEKNHSKALKIIPEDEIIIQEIIPGSGRNQFSACFLFLNGITYASIVACRMRQHPVDFGNATTYAEITDVPELVEMGERILKEAKYNGICEVEFKKDDRDGKFKFLEVNTRTWKWHSIANKAGTPFLKMFYDYLTGKKIEPVSTKKFASFRHALTDIPIQFILLLRVLSHWFRIKKPVENAVWDKNDPNPWFFEKLYLIYFLFKR